MKKDVCQYNVVIGRPRRRWIHDVSEWSGLWINEAARLTHEKERSGENVFIISPILHMRMTPDLTSPDLFRASCNFACKL